MSQTSNQRREAPFAFIGALASLSDTESRRVVAKIRHAAAAANDLSDFAGHVQEYIYRFTKPGTFSDERWGYSREEEAYALAALCFALHKQRNREGNHPPGAKKDINFGHSLRSLKDRLGDNGGPSLDLRFQALIDSPLEDAFIYLPHLVERIASHESKIPIMHARLLRDLLHWDSYNRNVQRNWNRAYWQHRAATSQQDSNEQR